MWRQTGALRQPAKQQECDTAQRRGFCPSPEAVVVAEIPAYEQRKMVKVDCAAAVLLNVERMMIRGKKSAVIDDHIGPRHPWRLASSRELSQSSVDEHIDVAQEAVGCRIAIQREPCSTLDQHQADVAPAHGGEQRSPALTQICVLVQTKRLTPSRRRCRAGSRRSPASVAPRQRGGAPRPKSNCRECCAMTIRSRPAWRFLSRQAPPSKVEFVLQAANSASEPDQSFAFPEARRRWTALQAISA